jgi:hypothetical protein
MIRRLESLRQFCLQFGSILVKEIFSIYSNYLGPMAVVSFLYMFFPVDNRILRCSRAAHHGRRTGLLHRYSGLKQRVIGERFGGLDEGLVSRGSKSDPGKD